MKNEWERDIGVLYVQDEEWWQYLAFRSSSASTNQKIGPLGTILKSALASCSYEVRPSQRTSEQEKNQEFQEQNSAEIAWYCGVSAL